MHIHVCLCNIYKLYTVFTDTQYLYGCVVIAHGYCIVHAFVRHLFALLPPSEELYSLMAWGTKDFLRLFVWLFGRSSLSLMFVFSPNCALHLLLMFLIRSNIAKTLLNCFWIISDMSQMSRLLREEIRWERNVSQSQMVSVTAEHTQRPLCAALKDRTMQFMSCFFFTSDTRATCLHTCYCLR